MPQIKYDMKHSFVFLFLFLVLCINISSVYSQDYLNTVSFDNQSGEPAVVKLIGPTVQILEVRNGQSRTVNVSAGDYYILTRYGNRPEEYKYAKGDPFTVSQTSTQYSAITITLHKVIGGNYGTQPISEKEFEKNYESPRLVEQQKVVKDNNTILSPHNTQMPPLSESNLVVDSTTSPVKDSAVKDKTKILNEIKNVRFVVDASTWKPNERSYDIASALRAKLQNMPFNLVNQDSQDFDATLYIT